MTKKTKRLSLLLALVMIVSIFASAIIPGSAEETKTAGIQKLESTPVLGDKIAMLVGHDFLMNYNDIANTDFEIKASYDVYLNTNRLLSWRQNGVDMTGKAYMFGDTAYTLKTVDTDLFNVAKVEVTRADGTPYADDTFSRQKNGSDYIIAPQDYDALEPITSTGYCYTINVVLKVKDAAAVTALQNYTETSKSVVEFVFRNVDDEYGTYTDVGVFVTGKGDVPYSDFVPADVSASPANIGVIPRTLHNLSYDVGAGTCTDMTPFATKGYLLNAEITPSDGKDLKIDADHSTTGWPQVFDYWKDSKGTQYNAENGNKVTMVEGGVKLTAVYADDKNENDIPDYKEFTIRYTLRDTEKYHDREEIVGTTTQNYGKAYTKTAQDPKDLSVYYNIEAGKGNKILDAVPDVIFPDPNTDEWELVGFFIEGDSTKYSTAEDLAKVILDAKAGETVKIEVRTMPNKNDNPIDDRDYVTLNFYAYGTSPATSNPIQSYPVMDGSPYYIYKDSNGTVQYVTDNADYNPTNVILPDTKDIVPDGYTFGEWTFNAKATGKKTDDGKDIYERVNVLPSFKEDQQVKVPDIVDPDDPDPVPEPEIFKLPIGGYVRFFAKKVDGQPSGKIRTIEITAANLEMLEGILTQVVEYGTGEYDAPRVGYDFAARDENNNPWLGWEPFQGGPRTVIENTVTMRVVDLIAYYKGGTTLTVIDQGTNTTDDDDAPNKDVDGNPFKDKPVTADATYEVMDENGDRKDGPQVLPASRVVNLPADEEMPPRNDDGQIFRKEWIPTETKNPNGSINYRFTPKYTDVTPEDIIILVDEDSRANGDGLIVLGGFYMPDVKATGNFYVNIGGAAAVPEDARRLVVKAAAAYGFEDIRFPDSVVGDGTHRTIKYLCEDTKTDKDGNVYKVGVFEVTHTTVSSGIIRVNLDYGTLNLDSKGYVVVTVADGDKNGKVNSSDYGMAARAVFGTYTTTKGYSADNTKSFTNELLNTDKDIRNRVQAADYGVIARMVFGTITSN